MLRSSCLSWSVLTSSIVVAYSVPDLAAPRCSRPPSLFSMAAPHPLFVLRGHRAPIHALCFRSAATNDKADAAAAGAALSSAASSQVIARPAASSAASRAVPLLSHAGPSSSLLCSGDAQGVVRVWNLATRRPTLTIDAHPGAPVLALVPLGSHSLLSQGKEGTIKLWDLQSSCTTPLRTLQTDSYTFFKMQLAPIPDAPLLLVPCETASNLALIDLRLPPSQNDGAVQLIECEKAIPRDPVVEDSLMSRMDEKDAREMQEMLASRPRQYERKVGIVMAAKFFDPKAEANSSKEEKHVMQSASSAAAASASIAAAAFPAPAASASSSSSSASSSSALPSLHVAWASEAGILGVWDIRASRQLFQHALHKDPILSFDLNWTGQRGVTVSAAKDVVQFNIDCNKVRMKASRRDSASRK